MNLLFIAFEFPPLGGGGVQRSMKFATYLPDFGIRPIVITSDIESFQKIGEWHIDHTLLDELPKNLFIERIPCPVPLEKNTNQNIVSKIKVYFSLLEPYIKYWKQQLEHRFSDLIKKHTPEAIYVSMPPFGAGLIGLKIAKYYHLPVILDFRDAWSQWRMSPYRNLLHYYLILYLERKCLKQANLILCTSDQTREDFIGVHKGIEKKKIITITNGYDVAISDWRIELSSLSDGKFIIGYVGNWYYEPEARAQMINTWWKKKWHQMIQYAPRKEDWLYRSPYFFFKSIAFLIKKRPDIRNILKIEIAGRKPNWIDEQIAEFGLKDIVTFHGYLAHDQVLAFQNRCNTLLITSSKVIGGKDYSIAGKTFEYFTMKKPILGFVAEGAQKDILEKSGMAVICNPDSIQESAQKIEDLIDGKIKLTPDDMFLRSLHRRMLTGKLAEKIRDCIR